MSHNPTGNQPRTRTVRAHQHHCMAHPMMAASTRTIAIEAPTKRSHTTRAFMSSTVQARVIVTSVDGVPAAPSYKPSSCSQSLAIYTHCPRVTLCSRSSGSLHLSLSLSCLEASARRAHSFLDDSSPLQCLHPAAPRRRPVLLPTAPRSSLSASPFRPRHTLAIKLSRTLTQIAPQSPATPRARCATAHLRPPLRRPLYSPPCHPPHA